MKLEQTILKNLIYNEEYLRKVLPFLKHEYFTENTDRTLFNSINDFVQTYNTSPTIEAIELAIQDRRNITNDEVEKCKKNLQEITATPHRSEEHTSELQSH